MVCFELPIDGELNATRWSLRSHVIIWAIPFQT